MKKYNGKDYQIINSRDVGRWLLRGYHGGLNDKKMWGKEKEENRQYAGSRVSF